MRTRWQNEQSACKGEYRFVKYIVSMCQMPNSKVKGLKWQELQHKSEDLLMQCHSNSGGKVSLGDVHLVQESPDLVFDVYESSIGWLTKSTWKSDVQIDLTKKVMYKTGKFWRIPPYSIPVVLTVHHTIGYELEADTWPSYSPHQDDQKDIWDWQEDKVWGRFDLKGHGGKVLHQGTLAILKRAEGWVPDGKEGKFWYQ